MGSKIDTLFKSIFFLIMLTPIFLLIYNFMKLNLSPIESVAFLFVAIILIIIFYYFLMVLMKIPDQNLQPYRSREVYRPVQPAKKSKPLLKKLGLSRKPKHKVMHRTVPKHIEPIMRERVIVKSKVKPLIKIRAPKPAKKKTKKVRKAVRKVKKKVRKSRKKVKKAVRKKTRKKVRKPKKKAIKKTIRKPKSKKKAHKKAKVKSKKVIKKKKRARRKPKVDIRQIYR